MVSSALITTEPLAGAVVALTLSVSPSRSLSLPKTSMVTGVSSLVVAVSSRAVGSSLAAETVTVTLAVALPPLPSMTV